MPTAVVTSATKVRAVVLRNKVQERKRYHNYESLEAEILCELLRYLDAMKIDHHPLSSVNSHFLLILAIIRYPHSSLTPNHDGKCLMQ